MQNAKYFKDRYNAGLWIWGQDANNDFEWIGTIKQWKKLKELLIIDL